MRLWLSASLFPRLFPLLGLEAMGFKQVSAIGDPLISTGGGWISWSGHVTTVWTLEVVRGVSRWSVMLVVCDVMSLWSAWSDVTSLLSTGSDVIPEVTGDEWVLKDWDRDSFVGEMSSGLKFEIREPGDLMVFADFDPRLPELEGASQFYYRILYMIQSTMR